MPGLTATAVAILISASVLVATVIALVAVTIAARRGGSRSRENMTSDDDGRPTRLRGLEEQMFRLESSLRQAPPASAMSANLEKQIQALEAEIASEPDAVHHRQ